MGEDEILPAAVNVERQIKVLLAHGRTFQMPARTTLAPRAFPEGFAGLGGLPQGKIQRIFLFLAYGDARAGTQIVHVPAGKLAVALEGTHAEIHVARRHGVGVAALDEGLNKFLHVADVFGGARLDIGTAHVQPVHILMEGGDVGFGYFGAALPLTGGAGDDFVVHVGEVADEGHIVAEIPQIAVQYVEHDGGTGMAYVAEVIRRDAAGVHAHPAGIERLEIFLAAGHGIIKLHEILPLCGLIAAFPAEKALSGALPRSGVIRSGQRKKALRKTASGLAPLPCSGGEGKSVRLFPRLSFRRGASAAGSETAAVFSRIK